MSPNAHMPTNPAVQPMMASTGAPLARPAMRNAATVSAMMPNDTSAASRAPADTTTMKPIAIAVLSEDSPASAPPAAPRIASAASHSRGLPSASSQVTPATADTASAAAMAMPRAPLPKCGVNSGTVITTMTSTTNRTALTAGGMSTRLTSGLSRTSRRRVR